MSKLLPGQISVDAHAKIE